MEWEKEVNFFAIIVVWIENRMCYMAKDFSWLYRGVAEIFSPIP